MIITMTQQAIVRTSYRPLFFLFAGPEHAGKAAVALQTNVQRRAVFRRSPQRKLTPLRM